MTAARREALTARAASALVRAALWSHALLLVAAPLAILAAYSVADRDELGDVAASPSLEAWRRALSATYAAVLARSLGWAALVTMTCVALACPVAYSVVSARPPWNRRLLGLVMIPFFTSILVRAYAMMTLLAADGWVAGLLGALGVTGPIELLYTPLASWLGLVSVCLPMAVIPIHASLEKVDGRLVEAALDLGATPARALLHVVWPLARPGVAAAVTLTFVPSIGMFAVVDLLGGGRTPLVGSVIATALGPGRDWPFGAAMGVCLVALFALVASARAAGWRRA